MRVYVASGLENRARAAELIAFLKAQGHSVTYDWTQYGDVRDKGEARMKETAQNEAEGVMSAELVLLLLPGGYGTHTELGMALCSRANKQIWLWSETGRELEGGRETCVFYHHPAVQRLHGSFEALLARVAAMS